MLAAISIVEIFGFPLAVMLRYEILYHPRQLYLIPAAQSVGDMADDDAGALLRSEGIMWVNPILVLGKESGVVDLAYVVVQGTGSDKLHIGGGPPRWQGCSRPWSAGRCQDTPATAP